MNEELSKRCVGWTSGLIGALAGILLAEGIFFVQTSEIAEIKLFQRENKPAIMRLYKAGRDGLYVEQEGIFVPEGAYLAKIPNEADREIERAEIRKAVRWYEE